MSDYLLAISAVLDGEPECTCCDTNRGVDTLGCPSHDDGDGDGGLSEMLHPETREAGRQWELDHPDGVISAEEDEAMARYAYESCREEGHRA